MEDCTGVLSEVQLFCSSMSTLTGVSDSGSLLSLRQQYSEDPVTSPSLYCLP